MLFNSYIFIFLFLPMTLCAFHFFRKRLGFQWGIGVLVVFSLIFYGWWNPKFLILLLSSIVFNFYTGRALLEVNKRPIIARIILFFGIAVNLGVLCYFKYANFIVDSINALGAMDIHLSSIVLPIGVSFFTFQKIAFLVDVFEGKVGKIGLRNYALFVTFFPQLIAGPITHHSELIPQFTPQRMKVTLRHIELGLTYFVIGLAKKVILADTAASIATPHFQAVAHGMHIEGWSAWTAALSYTVQLYFDFSAYTDMAIGIGQFFGIHLPINFNSPYKSLNMIDFWRRWHMTLSRFLRDYLYIPLGGNRKGPLRRYINLWLTMLLGGIWHGAGWTFIVWGVLHGSYLIINHAWREMWLKNIKAGPHPFLTWISMAPTFVAIVIGWVFFRSANVSAAMDMLKSMMGNYGWTMPLNWLNIVYVFLMLLMTWLAPNTQQLTGYIGPESTNRVYEASTGGLRWRWKPSNPWAVALGGLFAVSLLMLSKISEFIYFHF